MTPDSMTRLDAVIAEYLQAVERGQVPNRQELLDRHADLADDLRIFFAQLDHVDQLAAPLRLDPTTDGIPCPAPPDRIRYFGDYELLEEIARGGMGIVYKARQTSLNRIVALKMILKGTFATPRDVSRFRAEAESAANLDHPNIVPIHEVGEHDGHQYYTMRFIEGRPLNQTPRTNPRNESEQMITIARAVHYAHQRGILHRDLKPSNILISFSRERQASADSTPALACRSRLNETPFVVDFGLAKRLDANRSLTESGQIIGTPRYMAPEQAAGRRDLTIAADVYSLGVILYERLTGRTPFTGDDPLTIMRQVRETEPPRPSSITPGLDHDLQTVVLKCLEKEPAKRYASAAELADDLERWLRGEPILARPVGQVERFRRWCKRNPAVAGLTGAVAALLVCGIIGVTIFAMMERAARERAEKAEEDSLVARESLELELARSLLRPLFGEVDSGLSEPEVEALWDLATHPNEQLRSRFLGEATQHALGRRQLCMRSESALIAAIGLDQKHRVRAQGLLHARVSDKNLCLLDRAYLALAALELEDQDGVATQESSSVLGHAFVEASQNLNFFGTTSYLRGLPDRWEPNSAARVLSERLNGVSQSIACRDLGQALAAVAGRLDPIDSRKICHETADRLNISLQRQGLPNDRLELISGLAPILRRLDPREAAKLLVPALQRESDSYVLSGLAAVLAEVARGLPEKERTSACAEGAGLLKAAFNQETVAGRLTSLAKGVAGLSEHLGYDHATPICKECAAVMVKAIERDTNEYSRGDLAQGLARLLARLEKTEGTRIAKPVAALIAESIARSDAEVTMQPAEGLAAIAKHLNEVESIQILADALELRSEFWSRYHIARQLAETARKLDDGQASAACKRAVRLLTDQLHQETIDSWSLLNLTRVLTDLVPSLGADDARQQCRSALRLTVTLLDRDPDRHLAEALVLLASRLDSLEARQECSQVVHTLLGRLRSNEVHLIARPGIEMSIAILLSHLETSEAHHLARTLANVHCAGRLRFGEPHLDETKLNILFTDNGQVPCRLTTQELVELLKMPTCFGPARRVVLDQLENRYKRRFCNHWAFVRYAEEDGLHLDFTTPPKRPSRTLTWPEDAGKP